LPSPRSPSRSLFSQASLSCSHWPPARRPRPSSTRIPPGPICTLCAETAAGSTRKAAANTALSADLRMAKPLECEDATGQVRQSSRPAERRRRPSAPWGIALCLGHTLQCIRSAHTAIAETGCCRRSSWPSKTVSGFACAPCFRAMSRYLRQNCRTADFGRHFTRENETGWRWMQSPANRSRREFPCEQGI
jgi:hypothetical protein